MSEVELENFRESDRKRKSARVAAMSAVELENCKESKRKKNAASMQKSHATFSAVKRDDINAQRQKRHAAKRAASVPVSDAV